MSKINVPEVHAQSYLSSTSPREKMCQDNEVHSLLKILLYKRS